MNDATSGTHADDEALESVRRTDAYAGEPAVLDPANGADKEWPAEANIVPGDYLEEDDTTK